MMNTIQAHFDGRVIVPDEPVDLPVGQQLEIQICVPRTLGREYTKSERDAALERFLSRTVEGLNIPDEALRREALYADED
jgi:hypothetical protein